MKKLFPNQILALANAADELTDFIALENELALDNDGWTMLAPFGEHKKERVVNLNGTLTLERYIQILDKDSVDAVIANEKGTNLLQKLKRALVKRPIYRDHPDLKKYAPETVVTGNQAMIPLGTNGGCRLGAGGLEFQPCLTPDGAAAVENDGCKYPSALFLLKKTGVVRDGGWIEVRPFALASIGLTDRPNISGVDSLANARAGLTAAKQTDRQAAGSQQEQNDNMKSILIGWLAAQGIALANDATDQAVFDAFNKEMLTRSTSITTLGNDKQTLTTSVSALTGDKTKLVTGAQLPADLVTAANEIFALGNAKTEGEATRKRFIEARVDLVITQGRAPVADRTKEVDALLALGNDKLDAALTDLDKRPVKFAVNSTVDTNRKAGAGITTAQQAQNEIISLANHDPKYKTLGMSEAMKLIEKDHPGLFEILRTKSAEEKPTATATT